jgi:hypothetical protein
MTQRNRFTAWAAPIIGAGLVCATMLGGPAEARLSEPGVGGPISGGFFQGLPVRAQNPAARTAAPETTGVAGANCYVVRQVVRDRLGASQLRTLRVCE